MSTASHILSRLDRILSEAETAAQLADEAEQLARKACDLLQEHHRTTFATIRWVWWTLLLTQVISFTLIIATKP